MPKVPQLCPEHATICNLLGTDIQQPHIRQIHSFAGIMILFFRSAGSGAQHNMQRATCCKKAIPRGKAGRHHLLRQQQHASIVRDASPCLRTWTTAAVHRSNGTNSTDRRPAATLKHSLTAPICKCSAYANSLHWPLNSSACAHAMPSCPNAQFCVVALMQHLARPKNAAHM